MLKRTVVIGDPVIINDFKKLCRSKGVVASKVIINLMTQYIVENTFFRGKKSGKKAKSI